MRPIIVQRGDERHWRRIDQLFQPLGLNASDAYVVMEKHKRGEKVLSES